MLYTFDRNASAVKDAATIIAACGELVQIIEPSVLGLDLKGEQFAEERLDKFRERLAENSDGLHSSLFKKMLEEFEHYYSAMVLVTPDTVVVLSSPYPYGMNRAWRDAMITKRYITRVEEVIEGQIPAPSKTASA